MIVTIFTTLFVVGMVRADDTPSIADFANVTAGYYQVLAQSGAERGWQVNGFMNEMLKQYSKYFSNWSFKAGARVIVFSNRGDFHAYSAASTSLTHSRLTGYCQWKTDEDDNSFFELVTYDHEDLWQVLAHEGFHQFLGYELGWQVPTWLNEGLAQYFETSRVVNGRLQTGYVNKSRLHAAQYLIRTGRAPTLAELLQMDRATFYANAQTAYPMSWALVYYLMNRDGDSYRSSTFRRYLQDLKMSRDSLVSFQSRFGRMSNQWERDFERYIAHMQVPE